MVEEARREIRLTGLLPPQEKCGTAVLNIDPQLFRVGGKRQFVRLSRHQRCVATSSRPQPFAPLWKPSLLYPEMQNWSGLVLAVLSSPPIWLLHLDPWSARTITTVPFPTMLNGAPSVLVLGILHFILVCANSDDASLTELTRMTVRHHPCRRPFEILEFRRVNPCCM